MVLDANLDHDTYYLLRMKNGQKLICDGLIINTEIYVYVESTDKKESEKSPSFFYFISRGKRIFGALKSSTLLFIDINPSPCSLVKISLSF